MSMSAATRAIFRSYRITSYNVCYTKLLRAYLNFSETVVRAEKTELYDKVEKMLTNEINRKTFKFPVQNYIEYSVMTVISKFKGDLEQAKLYADLAEKNATTLV